MGNGRSSPSIRIPLRKRRERSLKSLLQSEFHESHETYSPEGVCLDDFRVIKSVGQGSFGKVLVVRRHGTRQLFAMKCVNKLTCFEKKMIPNVNEEIRILSSLDHPFVVTLWFTFQDEENMYLVFDFLDGGDLRRRMKNQGLLPEAEVLHYLCEVGLALDYLKSKFIIHRDIKPENLLLDSKGHIRIIDFNVAICVKGPLLAESLTGTKPYIAPEVYRCVLECGLGYSFAVDWWSLGICAYEMTCGKRPYDIHSTTSTEDILTSFQLSELTFRESMDVGMTDLIKRLLCVEAENRISSVYSMREHFYLLNKDFDGIVDFQITPCCVPQDNESASSSEQESIDEKFIVYSREK